MMVNDVLICKIRLFEWFLEFLFIEFVCLNSNDRGIFWYVWVENLSCLVYF